MGSTSDFIGANERTWPPNHRVLHGICSTHEKNRGTIRLTGSIRRDKKSLMDLEPSS